jgi:hypothetical protein
MQLLWRTFWSTDTVAVELKAIKRKRFGQDWVSCTADGKFTRDLESLNKAKHGRPSH